MHNTAELILIFTLKCSWHILWRHKNNQRLTKVTGNMLEHKRVVGVDDDKHWPTRERIQVARIQTVWLFVCTALASVHQTTVHAVPFYTGCQAAQLVTDC